METEKKRKAIAVSAETHDRLTDYQYHKKKQEGVKKSLDELINELLEEKEQRNKEKQNG